MSETVEGLRLLWAIRAERNLLRTMVTWPEGANGPLAVGAYEAMVRRLHKWSEADDAALQSALAAPPSDPAAPWLVDCGIASCPFRGVEHIGHGMSAARSVFDTAPLRTVAEDNKAALESLPDAVQAVDFNLPARVIVDQHGHYWRDYGDFLSMCPVSDENTATEVIAVFALATPAPTGYGGPIPRREEDTDE